MDGWNSGEGREYRRRMRRIDGDQAERLYSARPEEAFSPEPIQQQEEEPAAPPRFSPNEPEPNLFRPNEEGVEAQGAAWQRFQPGKPQQAYDATAYRRPQPGAAGDAVLPPPAAEATEQQPATETPAQVPAAYYRRPEGAVGEEGTEGAEQPAFAPPPRFAASGAARTPWEAEEAAEEPFPSPPQANIYQQRKTTWAETLQGQQAVYQVQGTQDSQEDSREAPRRKRRKKRMIKRLGIAACIVVVLGVGLYFSRDWLVKQLGWTPADGTGPSMGEGALQAGTVKGFDPAPATSMGEKARAGIANISGTLPMETVAVTAANVVTRVQTGDDRFDFYLFSAAEGRLLGYYEGLTATGFAVQPGDCFYVSEAPYLVNSEGRAWIDPSVYASFAGEDAVLRPILGGWSMVISQDGDSYNYVNAEGQLLSPLWFARAIPFAGDHTLAYVDTGNLAEPEERYTLYVLSKTGDMTKWKQTPDTTGVLGAACDIAYMDNGELILLEDLSTLCIADDVQVYLDCEAMAVRDAETGQYGLYVDGVQQYGFAYNRIAPVPCEIQWKKTGEGSYVEYAVTSAQYPQPLSHYFIMEKDGGQDLVALSTRSVYPVLVE